MRQEGWWQCYPIPQKSDPISAIFPFLQLLSTCLRSAATASQVANAKHATIRMSLALWNAECYKAGRDCHLAVSQKGKIMTGTTFRPLHDRVVVRRVESEAKTKGGIIIPDTAKEKPQEGEIVAVGSGARDDSGKIVALDVKAGDRILFGKWSGTEVKIDGEDLLIMKEADIMGIIG
jgi:chaperonin GroES